MAATVIVTFRARPGNGKQLRNDILQAMTHLAATAPGFVDAVLLHDSSDPDVLVEYERWDSADDHRRFLQDLEDSGALARFYEILDGPPAIRYLAPIAASYQTAA